MRANEPRGLHNTIYHIRNNRTKNLGEKTNVKMIRVLIGDNHRYEKIRRSAAHELSTEWI